jgi:putative endopeptidase
VKDHLKVEVAYMAKRTRKKRDTISHTPAVPPTSRTIRPGNDFYRFVNNKWLQETTLPADESSYGVSEEIEESIRDRFLTIIDRLMEGEAPRDPHEAAVRAFFKSGVHANRHRDHEKTFRRLLAGLSCMRGPEDYARELAALIRAGVPTLLSVGLGRDLEHPEDNVLILSSGSLSLPSAEYYKGQAPGGTTTLTGLETLMRRLGDEQGLEGLERIVVLEGHVADTYKSADSDDPIMVTGKQLESRYSSVPWATFFETLGPVPHWQKMTFMIGSSTWLTWLNRQFRIMPSADWLLWFQSALILYFAPLLPSPTDTLYFNYFGRRLRGDREKMTQLHLLYYLAQGLLMPSMSAIYKNCCLTDSYKRGVRDFVGKIRQSAIRRIGHIDWLSVKSRQRTQEKIRHMDLSVAEEDNGKHYKVPDLSDVDIIANMITLGKAWMDRKIYYAKHPELDLPVMDAVYEVNAHYYTSGNRLVIPGGMTLWPFYDSRPDSHLGWCYGGLGVVVGHEMLHGFDEDGKNYNQDGVYAPWWSAADVAAYSKRTKALIKLISGTRFMGRFLNGKATLSENIADLGGMGIALDALKQDMASRRFSEVDKKKALREFFLSYAVSWRTKERRQQSLYRLFTDVHAPAEIRVNKIVANFQEWYDVFEVQPSDDLWIDPKSRISIF